MDFSSVMAYFLIDRMKAMIHFNQELLPFINFVNHERDEGLQIISTLVIDQ